MPNIKDQSTRGRTVKQQAWVEAMLTGMNPTEAARAAKYSKGTEKQAGHVNMTNHDLTAEIDRRRAELSQKTEWTFIDSQNKLLDLAEKAETAKQFSGSISAIVAVNRMNAWDKDTQANPDQPLPLTPDQHQEAIRAANVVLATKQA